MTKKNLVRVSILDDEYAIRSDESPDHTRAVAAYLEEAIRRVLDTGAVVETNRAVMLAALQVTGELFEARSGSEITAKLKGLSLEVKRLLPPTKREPAV
jgi:cell division protein ZapA